MSLKGKNALLFGAGGILTGAAAGLLYENGVNVVLADLRIEAAKAVADGVKSRRKKGVAEAIEVNVIDRKTVKIAFEQAQQYLGTIDIVVNGVGGNHPKATFTSLDSSDTEGYTSILDLDDRGIMFVLELNYLGTMHVIQEYARHLMNHEGTYGNLIQMSSFLGDKPSTRAGPYSDSKAAVNSLIGWADHFYAFYNLGRVCGVGTGVCLTDQNRGHLAKPDGTLTERAAAYIRAMNLGRFLGPSDVAEAVLYLADMDKSAAMRGRCFPLDGGLETVACGSIGYLPRLKPKER